MTVDIELNSAGLDLKCLKKDKIKITKISKDNKQTKETKPKKSEKVDKVDKPKKKKKEKIIEEDSIDDSESLDEELDSLDKNEVEKPKLSRIVPSTRQLIFMGLIFLESNIVKYTPLQIQGVSFDINSDEELMELIQETISQYIQLDNTIDEMSPEMQLLVRIGMLCAAKHIQNTQNKKVPEKTDKNIDIEIDKKIEENK